MKSWKERMRKGRIRKFIMIVLLSLGPVSGGIAQEPQKQDLIVEEALDQIERGFQQRGPDEGLSLDPAFFDGRDAGMVDDSPSTPESPEEEAVVQDLELSDGVLPEGVGTEKSFSDPDLFAEEDGVPSEEGPETESILLEEENEIPEEGTSGALDVKVIPLLYAEAASLIERLAQMKSPAGEISYNEKDRTLILKDVPAHVATMSAFIQKADIPLETVVFALEHVRAKEIVDEVGEILTDQIGQVQFSDQENSIVVTDIPLKIGEIKELIKKLDRFNAEVLIGSRVLQIVLNDEHQAGVDWEAILSEYQELVLSKNAGGGSLSVGTISREDYDILMEALDTVGGIRTVSEKDFRITNETATAIDGFLSTDPEKEIRLRLTPIAKKEKTLEILISDREKREGDLKVLMQDGETIVVGGFFEEVMVDSSWKIPLLGDLPLLGFVFRNEGETARKAETINFMTVMGVQKKE